MCSLVQDIDICRKVAFPELGVVGLWVCPEPQIRAGRIQLRRRNVFAHCMVNLLQFSVQEASRGSAGELQRTFKTDH